MEKRTNYVFNNDPGMHWFLNLLFLVVFLVGGLFVGQFFGLVLSMVLTDLSLNELIGLISPPLTADKWLPLMLIQGMGALGGFIVGGLLHLNLVERFPVRDLFKSGRIDAVTILMTIVVVISFMFVNTIFIEWNAGINFPDFMKVFEDWASEKEDELRRVTEFLTTFDSLDQFLLGFLVIAILPAFGEELIFRGILQNKLHQSLHNPHLAIWISAILFSAFHIQFYGFLPRLLLGGLFGYLYHWSKNLWFPILGHFLNNGLTLTMIYLYHSDIVDVDIENEESYPLPVIITFAVITIYMLISLRRKLNLQPETGDE